MEGLIAYLGEAGFWHWWAFAAVLIVIEIMMPSTWLLWPGLGAAVVGLVVALDPSLTWEVQMLLFALSTGIIGVSGREVYAGFQKPSDEPLLNRRSDQYVGRRARVADAFSGGRGAVLVDDTRWSAVTLDGSNPSAGTEVEVAGADGTVLKVKTP